MFDDLEDARRFESAVKGCGGDAVRSAEVINDRAGTDELIHAEVEAAGKVKG